MLILCEQVENVPEHAAVSLVEFCVFAVLAGDVGEFFILNIEKLADQATCCADLTDVVGAVSAFRADEVNVFAHFSASFLFSFLFSLLFSHLFSHLFLDSLKYGIALFLRYLMLLQNCRCRRDSLIGLQFLRNKYIRKENQYSVTHMKVKAIITIALIISAALMAAKISPGEDSEQFGEGNYIHIDTMVIEFNRTDANVQIKYHLSPFAQVYMFMFGSKHLEPKIEDIFFDFENIEVRRIGRSSALIHVNDISRHDDEYYLHDSRELGMQPDILTLVYPDRTRQNIEYARATPDIFYV
ncbi:hypothetical protein MSMAL_1181 [Methanosarcina mazei LYC]|uniref:Uncharacterized protein n=3 Tax=Methanosarcina mazei TaxID=2209 RepID=A0A0E3RPM4_METMZ|nr:hypothetical protein MSMAL_1181 [Methanosarcina mazei LYC]